MTDPEVANKPAAPVPVQVAPIRSGLVSVARAAALTPRLWGFLLVALSLAFLFAPPFLLDTKRDQYWLGLSAKFMALAVLALSVDLVWGYTGLLSLGQGLFFGLGAYMLAYALTLQKAASDADVPVGQAPPQFMAYTGPTPNDPNYVVPPALKLIAPLGDTWIALAAAIIVPTIVAALFGWVIFRLRIRGVYFALVTQALLLAAFIIVRNQQRFTGGVVGIKDLAYLHLFGLTFNLSPQHIGKLNLMIAGLLVACFILCSWLMRIKVGRILTAIRDNENRVLALGYNTAAYKTFIFAFAGALAGLAGALYVAANRVCDSQFLSVPFSIEAVIWVVVGGRGSLVGALVGALLVGFLQSFVSSAFPEYWPIILGILFVAVVLFLPKGLTAVAGRGALLGVLIGAFLVNYLEDTFAITKHQRALLAGPVILAGVFLPRVLTLVGKQVAKVWSSRLKGPPLVEQGAAA